MQKRERWNSQIGFIISVIGAAVGLGNLWLFPWMMHNFGGMIFLIAYLIFTFLFVRLGVISEIAFGRYRKTGPIGSFRAVIPNKTVATIFGAIPGTVIMGILCFYLIVTGWIISYLFLYLFGPLTKYNLSESFFRDFSTSHFAIIALFIATIITVAIEIAGVKNGIEKINRVVIPLFFVLIFILLIRTFSLPGVFKFIKPLFHFSPKTLFSASIWEMALVQSFFSVSLGGILAYGGYLSKDMDIVKSGFWTVSFNTLASIMVALVIIPTLFVFNIKLVSGPGLLFVTIPKLCKIMFLGRAFGILFFACALFAAISSAINLMESVIATYLPLMHMSRILISILIGMIAFSIGVILTLVPDLFFLWVKAIMIYIYPFVPLIIQVVFLWGLGPKKAIQEIEKGSMFKLNFIERFILIYFFPIICFIVIILGILSAK